MSIYFIRLGEMVKIGFSDDVQNRVRDHLLNLPPGAEFLGHMPGGRDLELHLHTQFETHRVDREWFRAAEPILAIARIVLVSRFPQRTERAITLERWGSARDASRWAEHSVALRKAAEGMWPSLTHKARIEALSDVLHWRPRRVRAIYNGEDGGVIHLHEVEAIEGLFDGRRGHEPGAARPIPETTD